jgi:hypothetical protein
MLMLYRSLIKNLRINRIKNLRINTIQILNFFLFQIIETFEIERVAILIKRLNNSF